MFLVTINSSNYEHRYTFLRTTDVWAANRFAQQEILRSGCGKVEWLRGKYRTTSEAINKSTIIAIILLILRSFQRKGLCDSGLKAKSTTFVRNITTIRLRAQFVILKMNINMTDITEKTENGELVTNRDQLVVVDNIESLIKVIRGQQRYEREYSNVVEKPNTLYHPQWY